MIKKLTKHGNSYALVIEKSILQILDIDGDTPLKIYTNGKGLFIFPADKKEITKEFESKLDEVNKKYGRMLKKM